VSHKFVGFRSNVRKQVCPSCAGKGKRQVGSVDDTPLFQRCGRCNGTGQIGAALVKAVRDENSVEVLRWNPDEPIDEPYMRLTQRAKENNVTKEAIEPSVLTALRLKVTDEELMIAARIGITREAYIQQKAMDRLQPEELLLLRAGLTPVQILAKRNDR